MSAGDGAAQRAESLAEVSDEIKEEVRFEAELEFVQCLANPKYMNHLAQTLVLDDARMVAYLRYLLYWKRPEYAKFIVYPHCLYMLTLLQDKAFRDRLKDPQVAEFIHVQQFFHWQYFNAVRPARDVPDKDAADKEDVPSSSSTRPTKLQGQNQDDF